MYQKELAKVFYRRNCRGQNLAQKTYDYFHMPLLVRPNSILAVGSDSSRPDYDYAEGVTLYLVNLEDGKEAETVVDRFAGKYSAYCEKLEETEKQYLCAEGRTENVTYQVMEKKS